MAETTDNSVTDTGVGALLRASRMRIGGDLRDVALMLRIRYPYLEAIEEGRFEDLPGQAYAVGFVRAYADHFALDFDAADGVPVRLVMGLVSPSDAGVQHLHALAAMSRLTRDERMLHQLFEASSEEELYSIIANAGLRDAA